ncbi:MAG: hypothetical protein M3Q52_10765 [Pseudomonadota bacterium]|nr:hypothetical protein [Pseudomonadota bacterium]
MSIEGQRFYPGEAATPQQIILLANEYRRAADALRLTGRRGEPISLAPWRLAAIHAIELYLNAALRAAGHASAQLRGLRHDLGSRAKLESITKLNLRARTLKHLHTLSETREYLVTRYDPSTSAASQLNRLTATLNEVAEKAIAVVHRASE